MSWMTSHRPTAKRRAVRLSANRRLERLEREAEAHEDLNRGKALGDCSHPGKHSSSKERSLELRKPLWWEVKHLQDLENQSSSTNSTFFLPQDDLDQSVPSGVSLKPEDRSYTESRGFSWTKCCNTNAKPVDSSVIDCTPAFSLCLVTSDIKKGGGRTPFLYGGGRSQSSSSIEQSPAVLFPHTSQLRLNSLHPLILVPPLGLCGSSQPQHPSADFFTVGLH